jgi:hypothetical protein
MQDARYVHKINENVVDGNPAIRKHSGMSCVKLSTLAAPYKVYNVSRNFNAVPNLL